MVLHVGVLHCDSEQRVHNPENRFLSNTPLRLLLDNLPFSLNCSGKFPLDVTQNPPVIKASMCTFEFSQRFREVTHWC